MTDILAKILATKAEEIAAQKAEISLENMKVQARTAEPYSPIHAVGSTF